MRKKRTFEIQDRHLVYTTGKKIRWPRCMNHGCKDYVVISRGSNKFPKKLRSVCSNCHLASYGASQYREGVTPFKKDYCEICGRETGYSRHYDVDHISGNPHNNRKNNLQTVCLFCHKDKSIANGDFRKGHKHENKIVRAIIKDRK